VRVLVSYSKSNFFFDEGQARGFEQELLSAYETFLNAGVQRSDEQVKLVFVPLPFDRLLPRLREGHGDIAAAGLTITPERQQLAAFTAPYVPEVREVVVVNRAERGLHDIDDLAGRRVYVRTASSYVAHLESLSRKLVEDGRPPIEVVELDRYLVTEDILELVNAGVVAITVADAHIASAWADVFPDIVVRNDLVTNSGGGIAWAVRKNNPDLLTHLNAFLRKHRKGSLVGNVLFERYFENSKWIKNPLSETERKKLDNLRGLFEKYGDRYGFDWISLAAQAYQESGLDNNRRSRSGAVGIMQLLPSTAADKNVNIKDVHKLENNIHAGAKYMAFLRDRYFSDPDISAEARDHFSWAAYNAGPRKVRELRQAAERQGFDPNEWFFNVEKVAARVIGRETVNYVANIRKYYVAYKLQYEAEQLRQEARKGSGLG
jgi:membrane-bound lytic murein transglycosylase MltF